MQLSIVTSLYKSAPYLEEFCRRVQDAAQKITSDYELILVNDGSPDESLVMARSIQRSHPFIVIIDLSRNFGHHRALMTGLSKAQGSQVFILDCDLEEEPEWLIEFDQLTRREQCDMVYGVQNHRKGGWFERISGNLFYRVFNWISDIPMPLNPVTARLMSRAFVKNLLRYHERELYLFGLWHTMGFKQMPVSVIKHSKSASAYTLGRRITLSINALTSFSDMPLVAIFYIGGGLSLISGLYIFCLLVKKIFLGVTVPGWTSLVVSVWFLGGFSIFCMGIIGIYLSKIFLETKRRPRTIIRDIYRSADA